MDASDKITAHASMPPGLSQPALRALTGAGIVRLDQLTKFSEAEIRQLHGIGPNALVKLKDALRAKGLSYALKTETDAMLSSKKPVTRKKRADGK
jgi:hypothetical protein